MVDPDDSARGPDAEREAHVVSVKMPPFWRDRPEMWFFQVEAQFAISNIKKEETKFNHLVAQIEPRYLENIWDIVKSSSQTKYADAKERLLQTFQESEEKKIKRLISGLEFGDLLPSQLLRKMRALGNEVSDKVLKTLWMEQMPEPVRNVLVVCEGDLDKLATTADKIVEMSPRPADLAAVAAPSPQVDALLAKISALELQVAALSSRQSRDHHRGPARSRSRSRKRFDPSGQYCFYHFRFGARCLPGKCKQPCSWKAAENSAQQ